MKSFRISTEKLIISQTEDSVRSACSGEIITNMTEYKPGKADYSVIAKKDSLLANFFPPSISWIPEQYWPTDSNETELVLCLGREYLDQIQRCGYTNGITIERNQYKINVQLISIWDGEVIGEGIIEGGLPEECPEITNKGGSIKGDRLDASEIENWLEQVLGQ